MPKTYRVMVETNGMPMIGVERNMLGARRIDIQADENGDVQPGMGGISVNLCLCGVPPLILPRHLGLSGVVRGAKGEDDGREGWRMGQGAFIHSAVARGLELRPDGRHGYIGPDAVAPLATYQNALAATQSQWFRVTQKNNDCPRCSKITP